MKPHALAVVFVAAALLAACQTSDQVRQADIESCIAMGYPAKTVELAGCVERRWSMRANAAMQMVQQPPAWQPAQIAQPRPAINCRHYGNMTTCN